jgi:anti-anti-sigma factor
MPMLSENRQIDVDGERPIGCVRLRSLALDGAALDELGAELHRLVDEGYRRVIIDFEGHDPQCLYSVLLAKFVYLQRHLEAVGGTLALVRVGEHVTQLFKITGLSRYFSFFTDIASALEESPN